VENCLQHIKNITILLVVATTMLGLSWVGYMASDDSLYSAGALGWLKDAPFVGNTHWALRHPLVIPVALSYSLFGVSELSLVLVTTAYFLALLIVTYYIVSVRFDAKTGLLAALLLSTVPLFAFEATIAGVDIVEAFFVVLSLWFFHKATEVKHSFALFLIAGLMAGLAWWTRETTIGLLLFYALLFAVGYRVPRHKYWIMAAGFAVLVIVELAYFWSLTGDPFHRVMVDAGLKKPPIDFVVPGTGNIEVSPLLNPIIALLANNEFMLLFFLAIPAAVWAWRERQLAPEQQRFVRLLVGLMIVWFLVVGYGIGLRALPRYFAVTSFAAAVLVGLWLVYRVAMRSRALAIVLAATVVGANLLSVLASNTEPIFAERALVAWLKKNDGQIFTDPETRRAAAFLLEEAGLAGRATKASVPVGAVYFYNPNKVLRENMSQSYTEQYRPQAGWIELERIIPKRKFVGLVLEGLGMDQFFPARLVKRLNWPNEPVVIYRVMGGSLKRAH